MYKILFAFICMSVFFASDLTASANTDGDAYACPAMKVKRDQLQGICMAAEANQPGGCQPFKAEITSLDDQIKDECIFWKYSKEYPGGVIEKSCDCADDFAAVLRKFQKERDNACGIESRALMTKLRDLDDFKLAKERSDYLSRWFSGGGSTSDVHFKQFVSSAQWKSCSKRAYDKVMLEASDQLIEQFRSSGLSERERNAALSDWFEKTDGVTDDIIDSFDPWTHATYRASAVYWNTVMTTLQSKNTLDAFLPGAYDAVGEFFGYTISDEQRTGERPALDRIGNLGHVGDATLNAENAFAQYGPVLGVLFSQANLSEQEKFDLTNASTDALAVLGKVSDSISNGPYESYSENVAHAIKNFKPEEHSGDIGRSLNAIITIQKLARKHAGEKLTPAQENTFKALEQLVNVVTKTSELINTIDQNEENLNAALSVLDPTNDRESIAVIKSAGQFQIAETAIETVGEIWKSGDLIVDIFGSKQQQTSWKAVSAKVKLALDATSNATGSWNDSGVLVNFIQNTDNAIAYDKAQRDIVKLYGELGKKHFGASPSAANCACDKVEREVNLKEGIGGTCDNPGEASAHYSETLKQCTVEPTSVDELDKILNPRDSIERVMQCNASSQFIRSVRAPAANDGGKPINETWVGEFQKDAEQSYIELGTELAGYCEQGDIAACCGAFAVATFHGTTKISNFLIVDALESGESCVRYGGVSDCGSTVIELIPAKVLKMAGELIPASTEYVLKRLPNSSVGRPASSVNARLLLNKQLAKEELIGELSNNSRITVLAGAGVSTKIKDIKRLVAKYGGKDSDWQKITSKQRKFEDGTTLQMHAYKNVSTGKIYEPLPKP